MGFLHLNFGQEHLQCLNLLSASLYEFKSLSATDSKNGLETDKKCEVSADATKAMKYSADDIRAGPFTYAKASGSSVWSLDSVILDLMKSDFPSLRSC